MVNGTNDLSSVFLAHALHSKISCLHNPHLNNICIPLFSLFFFWCSHFLHPAVHFVLFWQVYCFFSSAGLFYYDVDIRAFPPSICVLYLIFTRFSQCFLLVFCCCCLSLVCLFRLQGWRQGIFSILQCGLSICKVVHSFPIQCNQSNPSQPRLVTDW